MRKTKQTEEEDEKEEGGGLNEPDKQRKMEAYTQTYTLQNRWIDCLDDDDDDDD